MYTLINREGTFPEIVHTLPSGETKLIAVVYNINTEMELIQFSPEVLVVPKNMLNSIYNLLNSGTI